MRAGVLAVVVKADLIYRWRVCTGRRRPSFVHLAGRGLQVLPRQQPRRVARPSDALRPAAWTVRDPSFLPSFLFFVFSNAATDGVIRLLFETITKTTIKLHVHLRRGRSLALLVLPWLLNLVWLCVYRWMIVGRSVRF